MKQTSRTAVSKEATARGERAPSAPPPKFFELIPPNPGIDFIRWAPRMIVLSWLFIVAGLVSIWMHGGLNYGIDFLGGTSVQVRFAEPQSIGDARAALDRPELRAAVVQEVGSGGREFQIRVQGRSEEAGSADADAVKAGLRERFGEGTYDVLRVETVGPTVGKDLWRQATLAVLIATVLMGIYIWFRFDLAFGVGAAVALIHDVLFTIAALSIADMEFDLTTVAALLTVVGFSVNDTVIISDRIRENMRKMRRETLPNLLNLSLNETLSRTVINSGTAILVTAALFLLGGTVIHSFAFALLVGFIVGTYSSLFIATPIVLFISRWRRAGMKGEARSTA
jgi:preprotein translocase subunit SecF